MKSSDDFGAGKHVYDEEASADAACYKAARRAGILPCAEELCDDGDLSCPDCPWKNTSKKWVYRMKPTYAQLESENALYRADAAELAALRSQVEELQRQLDEAVGQEPVGEIVTEPFGDNDICALRWAEHYEPAQGDKLYAEPVNLPAIIEQAKAEEREESLKVMRKAVVALAHAAESNPMYQDAYMELDAAIRARKP